MKLTVLVGVRSIAARKRRQQRPGRFRRPVDGEIVADVLRIVERPRLGRRLDEEVERIVDRHVGDEVDLDLQFAHRLGKDEAREEIAVGVLLQIDEMVGRRDLQRMAEHLGARMRRRLQPDDLRAEDDRPVVDVVRQVIDGSENGHGTPIGFGDRSGRYLFTQAAHFSKPILQCGMNAARSRRPAEYFG